MNALVQPQLRFSYGDLCASILAGVLSGSLDLLYVFLFHGVRGVSPERILQYIASGLQGRAAFDGGLASAALGAAAH